MNSNEPLAFRMRPKTLEEYVGQEHVIGPGKILYRTIKADRLSSIILFGPPGCGKTSLAKVISETTKYKFYKINAVTAGVADIKKIVEEILCSVVCSFIDESISSSFKYLSFKE